MASSSMYPSPEDYPEFDPIVLKCIGYLNVGGKESRRGLKELYQELVNDSSANQKSRGSSPSMKVRYPSFENSPKKGGLPQVYEIKDTLKILQKVPELQPKIFRLPGFEISTVRVYLTILK